MSEDTLEALRRQIDDIDGRMVALLNERAITAIKIGEAKRATGGEAAPIFDSARERTVLASATARNAGPLADDELANIFRAIIAACRRIQG